MTSERRTGDRRVIQRDWFGHAVQALGIVAATSLAIGLPLVYWGSSINTTVAQLMTRIDRQDRDISDQRQSQSLVSNQLLDVGKTLTRIDTQLSDMVRDRATIKR